VGTRGQFTTQRSGATVEGGPGLLDSLLVPALLGEYVGELVLDDVPVGVDCRCVLGDQLCHVGLLKPALLGDHLVELVLGPSFLLLISLH
jgi:hypothetical protein